MDAEHKDIPPSYPTDPEFKGPLESFFDQSQIIAIDTIFRNPPKPGRTLPEPSLDEINTLHVKNEEKEHDVSLTREILEILKLIAQTRRTALKYIEGNEEVEVKVDVVGKIQEGSRRNILLTITRKNITKTAGLIRIFNKSYGIDVEDLKLDKKAPHFNTQDPKRKPRGLSTAAIRQMTEGGTIRYSLNQKKPLYEFLKNFKETLTKAIAANRKAA